MRERLKSVVWLMPESPRKRVLGGEYAPLLRTLLGWLAKVGRVDEARDILARLRQDAQDPDSGSDSGEKKVVNATERVDRELADILEVVTLEKTNVKRSTYFAMLFGIGVSRKSQIQSEQNTLTLLQFEFMIRMGRSTCCTQDPTQRLAPNFARVGASNTPGDDYVDIPR